MADSPFEFIAAKIEEKTRLDKLEARGTLRIALKEAGLDPRDVTARQMSVVLEKTLPRELATRGIEDGDELCRSLVRTLAGVSGADEANAPESPEDVFGRLGGRADR